MNDICVLCLSKDRKLFVISDSYWHLLSSSLDWDDGEFQYIKCMQGQQVLAACWECRARLANFTAFMKQGQESINILKEYLKSHVQDFEAPISSASKLCKTEVQLINLTSGEQDYSDQTNSIILNSGYDNVKTSGSNIKLEIEPSEPLELNFEAKHPSTSNVKMETTTDDSNYIDIDIFMDPSFDTDDERGSLYPEPEVNALDGPAKTRAKKKLRSKNKIEEKAKLKDRKLSEMKPYYTVSWVSNEQGQQWYHEERDQERALHPDHAYSCDACDRQFADETTLKSHIQESHDESIGAYSCHLCLYRFPSQREKNQHIETHFILYKCKECSQECRTLSGIQEHNKANHDIKKRKGTANANGDKLYKCSRCKAIFASMVLLKKHRALCSVYKCEQCEKTFKYNPSYYEHLKTHRSVSDEDLMYCQVCDTYFKSAKWYKQHFFKSLKHVSRDAFKHECEHCGMKFSIPRRLQEHIGSIHLKTGIFQCEHCPKAYMTKGMLIRHRASQHNVGTVSKMKDKICDVCGKAFTSNHLLNNHMRSHTGEKPFKCEYCPSSFAQNGTLYTHSKVVHKKRISKTGHADTDRYRCEVCDKEFGTDAKRRVHYEFYHLKNAKYSCQVCNKNFISSTNLKNHNASRHGLISSRNYSCQTCGKTFNSASAKCQHMKTHSSERKLKCRSCDAAFRNTGALYMHYKMKHLKLKRGDRVSIKNLCKTDGEIIVNRDP